MGHGGKAEVLQASTEVGKEIDRIMEEIENLEKGMDKPEASGAGAEESSEAKVIPFQSGGASMIESDANPAPQQELVMGSGSGEMRGASSSAQEGSVSLKVGGCADMVLEFARAGVTITLSCNEDCLSISTDQGAEFRIPFKRAA